MRRTCAAEGEAEARDQANEVMSRKKERRYGNAGSVGVVVFLVSTILLLAVIDIRSLALFPDVTLVWLSCLHNAYRIISFVGDRLKGSTGEKRTSLIIQIAHHLPWRNNQVDHLPDRDFEVHLRELEQSLEYSWHAASSAAC